MSGREHISVFFRHPLCAMQIVPVSLSTAVPPDIWLENSRTDRCAGSCTRLRASIGPKGKDVSLGGLGSPICVHYVVQFLQSAGSTGAEGMKGKMIPLTSMLSNLFVF